MNQPTMTAVVQHRYGGPETLEVAEVPRPEPGPAEVLVAVRATCLNAADWHLMRGLPLMARLSTGLRVPRPLCTAATWPGWCKRSARR